MWGTIMVEHRLDVGFVPVECPGTGGSGATHTSTLLIEHLSKYHDLTVYVASQRSAGRADLPADDRVEYVISDELSYLPHPIQRKQQALEGRREELNSHDLVHSYSSAFISTLAELETETLVTLNSYLPVCPKADLRYRGTEKCSGPGVAKCSSCIASTALGRRQGVTNELKSAYLSAGRGPLVKQSFENRNRVTAYHALSPHLCDDYVELGFPADRITVVPHFYEDRFTPPNGDGADAFSISDGKTLSLLYVGALKQIKGVDVLIRSLPHLEELPFDVELRIAGSGPYESALRTLAADLGVADRISWLGYVDHEELPSAYHDSDVFVYPGVIDEPFGRVILEALASRTPVVSSDIGSMSYIIGAAGEVFEPGNERDLAEHVHQLRNDYGAYRREIPDQLDQFSPETVLEELLALYRNTAVSA